MADSFVVSLFYNPKIWSSLLLVPLIYIALIVGYHMWRIYRNARILQRGFPSAERHWLYGSLHKVKGCGPEFWETSLARARTFEYGFLTWIGYFLCSLQLIHPEPIKVVLKGSDPKSHIYKKTLLKWLGEGLLIKSGRKWARNRRLLTPAFHFDILKSYIPIYNDAVDIFMEKLERLENPEKGFEVFNHVSLMTLDVVLRCAFSFETDCQRQRHPYIDAVYEISWLWNEMIGTPLYIAFPWMYWWTAKGRRFEQLCDLVHKEAEDIIDQRKQALEDNDFVVMKNKKYLDFLDTMLMAKDEDGNGMTREDMRAEVDTFLFEGHDTTASGLSWVLYLLAKHPEYQAKAQAEVDEIMDGRQDKNIQWDDLSKMSYLVWCLKEAMRMYPPVAIIGREMKRDLEVMGRTVPKGTYVGIQVFCLHHNPLIWGEDHMVFKPERFSPEKMKYMDSHAFLPFSAGPRNCIGQNFALNEEKVILARLLHRFTFKVADDCPEAEPVLRLVMRTKKDLKLVAVPRH